MATCVPPWEIDPGCCAAWCNYDENLQDRAIALAWNTLSALTAGRVGRCPTTVRPCLQPPCDACAGWWINPVIYNGRWYNNICGMSPRCSCERMCEIVLPGPVAALTSVNLDGVEIDLGAFRVDNGNRLVRQDGTCWPSCQNMNAPEGDVGTLTVTYVPGIEPDASGLWAAGVLACEYAAACSSGKCRLPSGVTAIARQGVSMVLSTELFPGGLTGIREVDAYVYSVNPNRLKVAPMVWSPDLANAGHRTVTWP